MTDPTNTPADAQTPDKKAEKARLLRTVSFIIVGIGGLALIVLILAFPSSPDRRRSGTPAAVEAQDWKLTDDASQKVTEFTRSASAGQEQALNEISSLRDEQKRLTTQMSELMRKYEALRANAGTGGPANDENIDRTAGLRPELLPYVGEVVRMLEKEAVDRGVLDYRPSQPQVRSFLNGRLPNETISDSDVETMARNCRVIPQRISDDQVQMVARLAAQRDAERINREDVYAVGRMIWRDRAKVPAFTAGQLLKLAQLTASASSTMSAMAATEMAKPSFAAADVDPGAGCQTAHLRLFGANAEWGMRGLVQTVAARTGVDVHTTTGAATITAFILQTRLWSRQLHGDVVTPDMLTAMMTSAVNVGRIAGTAANWAVQDGLQRRDATLGVAAAAMLWDILDPATQGDQISLRLQMAKSVDLEGIDRAILGQTDPYAAILAGISHIAALPDGLSPQEMATTWNSALEAANRVGMYRDAAVAEGAHPDAVRLAADGWVTTASIAHGAASAGTPNEDDALLFRRTVVYYGALQQAVRPLQQAANTYASMFATVGEDWSWIDGAIRQVLVTAAADAVQSLPAIEPGQIVPTTAVAAGKAAEHGCVPLAEMAINKYLHREIQRMAVDRDVLFVDRIIRYAEAMSHRMVQPPLTAARLQSTAKTILRECREIIEGRRQLPDEQGTAITTQNRAFKAAGLIQPRAVQITRSPLAAAGSRIVTIPAGSYGDAYMVTSAKPEITGKSQDVLIKLAHTWEGPNRIKLQMRDLLLTGEATALAGSESIEIRLTGLSYTFKSGRQFYTPVEGWAANVLDGGYGLVGTYHYNLDKFLKTQGAVALFEWTGVAVNNLTQRSVSQGANSMATVTQAGGQAVSSSAQAAATAIQPILTSIKPTVEAPNGQRIKVILKKPVPIPIPLSDWETAVTTTSNIYGFR